MNELTTVCGIVENFERSTDVRGTSNRTSTTHLSIFDIGPHRVLLKTATPSVISNGDNVAVAGQTSNGQFHAVACKNSTANWISPLKQQGCVYTLLIGMAVVSFLLFFMVLPIVFGGICVYFAIKVKKYDNTLKQAHQLILNA
jgi:hypothetical protein